MSSVVCHIRAFNRISASLRHTEQLRKKMVIDVAHELRTPLPVTLG